ncbi:Transposase for transposon Tn5 [Wolbachia endosymbiont of Cylisticus convexus]|nr:Transposase for transposon Tn5 [Wolbachia endosymbiont of Cylisticus convexus]
MESKSNEWAKNEFGNAVLGDKRLTDRLVEYC